MVVAITMEVVTLEGEDITMEEGTEEDSIITVVVTIADNLVAKQ